MLPYFDWFESLAKAAKEEGGFGCQTLLGRARQREFKSFKNLLEIYQYDRQLIHPQIRGIIN
jgi:hypothetical protein